MTRTAKQRDFGLKLWKSSAVHRSLIDLFAPSHLRRKTDTPLKRL